MILNHRSSFNSLAEFLILEGDTAKAREVLMYSLTKMPDKAIPYDYTNAQTVELLFEVGEKEKALEISNIMSTRSDQLAAYYISNRSLGRDLQMNVVILGELQRVLYKYGEADEAKKIEDLYDKHANILQTGFPWIKQQLRWSICSCLTLLSPGSTTRRSTRTEQ